MTTARGVRRSCLRVTTRVSMDGRESGTGGGIAASRAGRDGRESATDIVECVGGGAGALGVLTKVICV